MRMAYAPPGYASKLNHKSGYRLINLRLWRKEQLYFTTGNNQNRHPMERDFHGDASTSPTGSYIQLRGRSFHTGLDSDKAPIFAFLLSHFDSDDTSLHGLGICLVSIYLFVIKLCNDSESRRPKMAPPQIHELELQIPSLS